MGIVSVCSIEKLNSFAIVKITNYSESWEICSTEGKIWRCSDKFECWQTWLSQQQKEIQRSAFVHLCSVCCWYWRLVNTSKPKPALAQLKEKKMPNHGMNSSVSVSLQVAARWKVKSWRKQQTFTIAHIIEEHKVLTKQFPLLSFFLEFNKRWEAGRSIYNDKCACQGHYTIVQPQNPTVVMQTVQLKTHSDRWSVFNDYVSASLNLSLPKGKVSISEYKGKHKERTDQDNESSNNRLSAESLFLLFIMFRPVT